MKNVKGITLIALIITIVVLIILAAVAINLSLGNNGIFNLAKTAKEQYSNEQVAEQGKINNASNEIDSFISGKSRDTIIQGLEYVGLYTSTANIKNNVVANITVNGLTAGEQYSAIVFRATTGGTNSGIQDTGTSFTNATYQQYDGHLYNFIPSENQITISQANVSFGATKGSTAYAFVFKGKFE